MSFVKEDLGRYVLGRAADRVRALVHYLRESVVNEFEVAVVGDHDVFGLEVAVDDVFAVEVLEDRTDLRAVEAAED